MPHSQNYEVAIRPISSFRTSEEIDTANVRNLMETISNNNKWLAPIVIEKNSGIVMDGNHRLRAAIMLGLKYLPCIPLCYTDPRVTVFNWNTDEPFDVAHIYQTVLNNQIFPYKTTRHRFSPVLPGTDIPLALLTNMGQPDTTIVHHSPDKIIVPSEFL
jgi:hypothetical protein